MKQAQVNTLFTLRDKVDKLRAEGKETIRISAAEKAAVKAVYEKFVLAGIDIPPNVVAAAKRMGIA